MLNNVVRALTLTLVLAAAPAARTFAADETQPAPAGGHTAVTAAAPAGHDAAGHDATGHEKGTLIPAGGSATFLQALWVMIIFLIVLAILYPTAWKNVLAGLKAREQRIRTDIAEAEAARARADATLREYNTQLATAEQKVRDMLAAATADAERAAAAIRARGEAEANDAKDRATKEIEAASKQAIAQVYEQTANLATSVAEKILRRSINADDQRDLVARSLEQVENVKNN
jgi:F-type H+-transporting ATPase subunit b